jgi:pimeloyl-ACP methyl ester carboxylesterase
MGLNTGEAELREGDYFGTAVNRAARLAAVGHGGQILRSSATAEVADTDIFLVDLSEHRLRDLDRPMHAFQVGDYRAAYEADVRALLPSVSVPALVLHREHDRMADLGVGRYLAEQIPGARG